MAALPPLNALRAFEAAIRLSSFARAAEELHVTAGAVSRQIKLLEQHLGVTLFHRTSKAVEPTEAAKSCLPKLREGFEALAAAVDAIRAASQREILTLGVAPSFAARWLLPRLHDFVARHPEVELRLSASRAWVDRLRHDAPASAAEDSTVDTDLAIRFGTGVYPGHLSMRLFDISVTPMLSAALITGAEALVPSDLSRYTLLHDDTAYFDDAESDWDVWLRAAGAGHVDATRGPRFSHSGLALDAAAQGMGAVLASPVLAVEELQTGALVAPFALKLKSNYGYYLVYPGELETRPAVAAFRQWLLKEVEDCARSASATSPA